MIVFILEFVCSSVGLLLGKPLGIVSVLKFKWWNRAVFKLANDQNLKYLIINCDVSVGKISLEPENSEISIPR